MNEFKVHIESDPDKVDDPGYNETIVDYYKPEMLTVIEQSIKFGVTPAIGDTINMSLSGDNVGYISFAVTGRAICDDNFGVIYYVHALDN